MEHRLHSAILAVATASPPAPAHRDGRAGRRIFKPSPELSARCARYRRHQSRARALLRVEWRGRVIACGGRRRCRDVGPDRRSRDPGFRGTAAASYAQNDYPSQGRSSRRRSVCTHSFGAGARFEVGRRISGRLARRLLPLSFSKFDLAAASSMAFPLRRNARPPHRYITTSKILIGRIRKS